MAGSRSQASVEALALAVAAGQSVRGAAQTAGVSESTARRIVAEPGFRAKVDGLRSAVVSRAVGLLATASIKAATRLVKLIDSEDERIALAAARAVLADLMAVQDHAELDDRIRALEERQHDPRLGRAARSS